MRSQSLHPDRATTHTNTVCLGLKLRWHLVLPALDIFELPELSGMSTLYMGRDDSYRCLERINKPRPRDHKVMASKPTLTIKKEE